jgi:hypothetical protein
MALDNFRAKLARWIIVNIACRISSMGVLDFCFSTVEIYQKAQFDSIDFVDPDAEFE